MDKPLANTSLINNKQLHSCPSAFQAQQNPDKVAVVTDSLQLTYAQLHHQVTSLSQQLIQLNMKKGDRLVSIAENGLPLLLLQLTCVRNGFIFCPINPKFTQAEISQRLAILNSNFIYQEDDSNTLLLDFSARLEEPTKDSSYQIDATAVTSIIFTSGSSGSPKAVMHNFSNHYYSALGSQTVIPLTEGDNNLLSLPLFHISGYATVMRTLLAGATLHISEQKIGVVALQQRAITHLSLVSTQLQQLLKNVDFNHALLAIKHLLLGGSAFPSSMLKETKKRGFTYHLSYGSTEMASQIATSTNNETLKLLPYRSIKMVDNEIYLAGETRFVGYFTGDISNSLMDKTRYFATADLGELVSIKAEQSIKIIGRKDRQFISGGENIQPEEIEKRLLASPEVSQVYVLPISDANYGQRPIAFIKWRDKQQTEQLKIFMQDKLIAFKQPLHYFTLPEQAGLKPQRKQLTAIAQQLLGQE